MLLWPYMMAQGFLPYKDMAIAHTPHLLVDLAVFFKIFGTGVVQLKIYTWLLVIACDLLVFWVTNKLWSRKIALASVFSFSIAQIFFDGNGLWFDLMLAPLSLFTYYLMIQKKYFWSGVVWALMFLTKQTAVWFLIPMGITILQNKTEKFNLSKSTFFGALSVIGLFTLILIVFGIFPDFYNWAIKFGVFILPGSQGQIQLPDIKNLIIAIFPFTIFLPFLLNKKTRNVILLLWAMVGAMGVYPRFEYFHIQPALPFLAIVLGLVITQIKRKGLVKLFMIFYLVGSIYLFANYFMRNWREGTRFLEADVASIVSYVKNNTQENEKIFVLNWWDNIYPLTKTIPATDPWVPQLAWYQNTSGIQEKEIEDLKSSKPKLILFKEYEQTGLAAYVPQRVYEYVIENYKLKEKIDGIQILIPRN